MTDRLVRLFVFVWCVGVASSLAYAQGASTTSSIQGVVVDKDGGAIPGATVVVKNNATSVSQTVTTNGEGAYSVPALDLGMYTVTISLSGFKSFVHTDVRLQAGQPASLRALLEIGAITETVNVRAASELVQTTSTAITNSVPMEVISNLPVVTRNALNFVTFLPGVSTPGTARASTINGLPDSTINITIDGVTTNNLLQTDDGFFSMITPRLDAVQEVTVQGAGAGAESAGGGSVQIKFVTRSGTNVMDGSAYHYFRHPSLNSNYFFNQVNGLDKNEVIVHQYGFRLGGPIVLPGMFDGRGKAFFFFNYERFYQPTEATRTRTILTPEAEAGLFRYTAGGATQSVNLLALAAANGQLAVPDQTVVNLLAKIRQATGTTGNITEMANTLNRASYIFQSAGVGNQHAPTSSVDVNLSSRHRLKGTYYLQRFNTVPDMLNGGDARFPGFANFGNQASWRTTGSVTLRSTLGSTFVNELIGGWQHSPNEFSTNITPSMFNDQDGFSLALGGTGNNAYITGATTDTTRGPRNTPNWNVDNNISWLRGSHSLTFGGSFLQVTHTQNGDDIVPSATLAFNTTFDPAAGMFTTANFPGASNNILGEARTLYAILTGRVSQIPGTARLNNEGTQYVYLGNLLQRDRTNSIAAFFQDSWRMKPTFTLNYGVRWEVMMPFYPLLATRSTAGIEDLCGPSGFGTGPGGRQCNMFNPGVLNNPTQIPQYVPYNPGDPGFETAWFDFGPNVGMAWRPNVQDGWLRALLGDPDQATVRGVFSTSFNRPRMDAFTGTFNGNPGGTAPGGATRGTAAGNYPLVLPGETWPVLFREKSRLGPPQFVTTPQFPIQASITGGNDINIFDPAIRTPFTNSWSLGIQRSLGTDTAIEFRYVGNRLYRNWTEENWNIENIFENGFLEEFKLAQANLAANVAAGRGGSFAYMGPNTGTSPLPTYLAYFSGNPAAQAGDASRYTSTNFTNSTFTGHLDPYFADPRGAAAALWTGSSGQFRTNAAAAGVASNFFVMNPLVDDAQVTVSKAGSYYHSFVIDVRRRLARGLLANVNYTWARQWGSSNQDLHRDRLYLRNANVPHAIKTTFNYQIPVGRGKRYGTDLNPWVNGAIGNWELSGTGRVQWREFVFRGKLVGMSQDELQDVFKIRYANSSTGALQVFIMPQDIIDNTRRAFNTDETSTTGYPVGEQPTGRYIAPAGAPGCIILYTGDCGQEEIWVRGPSFVRFDMTLKKRFPFGRKASFDLQVDFLNAFDNINFNQVFNPGAGAGIFQITSAYTDINSTFDPGGRLGQIVWRINW